MVLKIKKLSLCLLMFLMLSLIWTTFLMADNGQVKSKYFELWQSIYLNREKHIEKYGKVRGRFEVGVALANTGLIEEAVAVFQEIPGNNNEGKKILDLYQNELKRNPRDIQVLNYLAFGKFVFGEYKQSKKYFEKALKLDSENIWLMNFLSVCLASLKDFKSAHMWINRSFSLSENDYTYIFRAIVYYSEGKKMLALRDVFRNLQKSLSLLQYFK